MEGYRDIMKEIVQIRHVEQIKPHIIQKITIYKEKIKSFENNEDLKNLKKMYQFLCDYLLDIEENKVRN